MSHGTSRETGDRIYYTGDVCNNSGWFVAEVINVQNIKLTEQGGENRVLHVMPCQIGDVYQGHCNPRFVTEQAYATFYATSIENLRTHVSFRRIR